MGYQDCPCFKCDHGGERYGRSMQSLCRDNLHGHLCRSGALQTRVPGDDRPDKAADN